MKKKNEPKYFSYYRFIKKAQLQQSRIQKRTTKNYRIFFCTAHKILACHFMRISSSWKKPVQLYKPFFSLSCCFSLWLWSFPLVRELCVYLFLCSAQQRNANNIWPINLLMFQVFSFQITGESIFKIMKLFCDTLWN